jgi:putative ABC transport system substrate-binding protein
VFFVGGDPLRLGLVSNLSHPGGNLTGLSNFSGELATKRLEFLRQIIPAASAIGVLLDRSAADASALLSDSEAAAKKLHVSLHVHRAGTEAEIRTAFEQFAKLGVGGIAIPGGLFLTSRSTMLAQLSNQYSLPSAFQFREFAAAGGLVSYGGSFSDMYREVGIYVGRILNGERAGDLPVQQSSKVELIINLRTAKALGVDIPLSVLGRADEVIE